MGNLARHKVPRQELPQAFPGKPAKGLCHGLMSNVKTESPSQSSFLRGSSIARPGSQALRRERAASQANGPVQGAKPGGTGSRRRVLRKPQGEARLWSSPQWWGVPPDFSRSHSQADRLCLNQRSSDKCAGLASRCLPCPATAKLGTKLAFDSEMDVVALHRSGSQPFLTECLFDL